MKESAFAAKVMKQLRAMPEVGFATRVESGDVAPGIPDIYIVCRHNNRNRSIWLELKTNTGRLRPAQKLWHAQYQKTGGLVGVIRPKDNLIEKIKEILRNES